QVGHVRANPCTSEKTTGSKPRICGTEECALFTIFTTSPCVGLLHHEEFGRMAPSWRVQNPRTLHSTGRHPRSICRLGGAKEKLVQTQIAYVHTYVSCRE